MAEFPVPVPVDLDVYGKRGYPIYTGAGPFERAPIPMIGDKLIAWRPYNNRESIVEHVHMHMGAAWVWFKGDNRWFPDGVAFPYSRFHWKR